ncbi:unnamed protein product [Effrenium voratum]|nr:unnamed protein product [Effrenium voratum]
MAVSNAAAPARKRTCRSGILCVLALCFGKIMRLEATAVGGNDLRRRLDVSDEFENAKARVEEARGDSQGSTSQSSGREGKRRELRTPPVVEDIIAGALVGAVTGAVAGAGSGAALGGAGNSGFAGAAGGAASGGALGLTSGAVAGAAMATANPDAAATGLNFTVESICQVSVLLLAWPRF